MDIGENGVTGKTVTLYLDEDLYENYKKLCASKGWGVSQRFNVLMRGDLKEEGEFGPVDYSRLRSRHLELANKVGRMERQLEKRKVLKELDDLIMDLGLDDEASNIDEVAPKLIEKWRENPSHIMEDVHVYITFIENIRDKRQIERRLEEVRTHGGV